MDTIIGESVVLVILTYHHDIEDPFGLLPRLG
jgi:hypothetical protein